MTAPAKWHESTLIGFDTESTGISPLEDHIVTAAVVHASPGARPRSLSWLIHPERDIPEEAAQVHGWTLARIEQTLNGAKAMRTVQGEEPRPIPKDAALNEIACQLAQKIGLGVPVVVANAPFDFTMLETECARHDVPTLSSRPSGVTGIVDPQVIEKQYDRFRKQCYKAPGCNPEEQHHECGGCRGGAFKCGGCGITDRKLGSLCRHYGIAHTGLHDAAGDALAAIRLARRVAGLWPEVARYKLSTLHGKQVEWRRDQQIGLRDFFRKVGKNEEAEDMCPEWPVHRRCVASKAVA